MRAPRPTASRQARARSSASRRPASSSGTATFSSAVMVAIRWKDWKTMPTFSRRSLASSSSVMAPRSRPATETRPGGRPLQPGSHQQGGGLAGPGGAHHGHRLARRHREVDAAEHIDRPGGAHQSEVDILQLHRPVRACHERAFPFPTGPPRRIWPATRPVQRAGCRSGPGPGQPAAAAASSSRAVARL